MVQWLQHMQVHNLNIGQGVSFGPHKTGVLDKRGIKLNDRKWAFLLNILENVHSVHKERGYLLPNMGKKHLATYNESWLFSLSIIKLQK